ncbi:MAG: HEAT repeat domain-containing protein [Blastopirellula sp. JB062]
MSDRLNEFLLLLSGVTTDADLGNRDPHRFHWIAVADELEVSALFQAIEHLPDEFPAERRSYLDTALNLVAMRLRDDPELPENLIPRIAALYCRWGADHPLRHLLLPWLTANGTIEALSEFAELIADDPPNRTAAAAVGFAPLMRHGDFNAEALYPRLLDALQHLSVAALVLDLSNFLFRTGRLKTHPAAQVSGQLIDLLGGITTRLGQLEETSELTPEKLQVMRAQVSEGVAMAVALCDALALIGDKNAIGKLNQVIELSHRQLQCEAAAALARLGVEEGSKRLAEMAKHPVARLRALKFAEEIDQLELIEEEWKSPVARAEGELALWLSQETQFGLPPHEIELVDQRELAWPGFQDPQTCYLFRYAFHMPAGSFQSLGMVGPLTHSFAADLTPWKAEDAYAAFAGWQAEHQDVFESDPAEWQEAQKQMANSLVARLQSEGYEVMQAIKLGYFFGDVRLIAVVRQADGLPGVAVADLRTTTFYSSEGTDRPIGPHEAYMMHKGREFLANFNPNTFGI